MMQEKKTARCYINAYEDLFEDLCVFFGEAIPNEQLLVVQAANPTTAEADQDLHQDGVVVEVGPPIDNAENPIVIPPTVVNIISDSSDSSGEFWRVIESSNAQTVTQTQHLPCREFPLS
ncbi:UNVERIFIED_CONTAM: hypothetical protein Sangu_2777800 [Sesamum angustifolium]|uniref:Uncharacterized protein n=1 Tax=Sesamum angustifolium TaxID=2727405 RepID=A0AAW2IUF9_9LAMI